MVWYKKAKTRAQKEDRRTKKSNKHETMKHNKNNPDKYHFLLTTNSHVCAVSRLFLLYFIQYYTPTNQLNAT